MPLDETRTFHHSYRAADTYQIHVQVTTAVDCAGSADETATVELGVVVPAVAATANGPQPPEARLLSLGGLRGTSDVTLGIEGRDEDGWVIDVVVDWGDGTPPESMTVSAARECSDSASQYPSSLLQGSASHTYAEPGVYTVHMTAKSTGCDGSDEQSGTGENSENSFTIPL